MDGEAREKSGGKKKKRKLHREIKYGRLLRVGITHVLKVTHIRKKKAVNMNSYANIIYPVSLTQQVS